MDNNIRISLPEVEESCHSMRTLNGELDEVLSSISSDMHSLQSYWQSTGAETIMNQFDRFASRFVVESETIEDYCRFLDYTVQTYNSLESTITSNAEACKQ